MGGGVPFLMSNLPVVPPVLSAVAGTVSPVNSEPLFFCVEAACSEIAALSRSDFDSTLSTHPDLEFEVDRDRDRGEDADDDDDDEELDEGEAPSCLRESTRWAARAAGASHLHGPFHLCFGSGASKYGRSTL